LVDITVRGALGARMRLQVPAFLHRGPRKLVSDSLEVFLLPDRLDLAALQDLKDHIHCHVADPVRISAEKWRSFDTLTLQFLLATARDWSKRGLAFEVTDISAEIGRALRQVGVTPEMLIWTEAR
jgi:hypothetical protein